MHTQRHDRPGYPAAQPDDDTSDVRSLQDPANRAEEDVRAGKVISENPRDLLEDKLAAVWRRLFQRTDIGRNDNFFQLGGHSLLAVQLAYEVEKLVGHRLPIALFFRAPTIAELSAMLLAEEGVPAWSSLIPLYQDGKKAPLFFLHGYGGDVYVFLDLARVMERERPVYGVQAVDLDGRQPRHETMEQMAAHYAREIRSLQPAGPYYLAGYSMGGWIAYAVAQELRKEGREVAFLGLFDTHATANVSWRHYALTVFPHLVDRGARHLRRLRDIPWSGQWSYLAGPLRTMWFFLTRSQRKSDDAYATEQGWEADHYNLIHACYRPSAYDGTAEIFVAKEEKHFPYAFWKRMVRGRVRFHQVDGSHKDMLSAANCPALARKIEAVLLSCTPQKITGPVGGQGQDPRAADGSNGTIHRRFEEQAAKTPDAVAVEFGEENLTYRELDSRADRLASSLLEAGAGPDEVVGIYAPMSPDTLVGMLAVLKAGAAYLPVDMALPRARRAFLLRDSQCKIVLVRAEHTAQLLGELHEGGLSPRIVPLDGSDQAMAGAGERTPAFSVHPENLAYVLYTSGSTGQPKGVEMPHRALVNLLGWQKSISSDLTPGRTLQFANLGFDVSFQEIFSALTSGGTLVLVDNVMRLDPEALLHFVDRRKIDHLFLPFVVLEQLAAAAETRGITPVAIKEIFVAGEQLRIGPGIRRFFSRLPGVRLWNHYGPTETHVVTGFMLEGDPDSWPDLPPIGRALPNCEIHLLDESLRIAAAGAAADLYVSGLPLARGYRNQPELTAERFVDNPFGKTPGEKMYKTGDVARRLPDGSIEFLGRSDFQVKIRGHRIELGEVEAVVGQHPDVAGCAVLAKEGFGGRQLIAFVVPRKDADLSLVSLREWVGRQLPDYMMPVRFALLEELPLNSNGKVDRQALAQTKGREVPTGAEYAAPRHELEQQLSEIWQEVLAREAIGIHDNFFEMGGNSLLMTVCCVEINKRLGLQVPLGLVFTNPTIGDLADKLATFSDPSAPIPRADRHRVLPASFAQEGLWFVQQILPDSATYNQPFAWRFTGPVDEKRLRAALETVMSRHEMLRTGLVFEEGGLQQKISPAAQLELPWRQTVISAGSDPTGFLREESRRPFDLVDAPLWRALWVKLADDDNILLLTFHHSIIDEWSMRVLVAELQSLYAGDVPADLPLQYADYAVWQRRNLSAERLEAEASYWRQQLADLPAPLSLAAAVKRPPQATGRGVTHGFELPVEVVMSLRSLARAEGTTVFVVMLAAFQLWLHRCSGQTDLVVGTPFAERDRPEIQPLIGCFLNTLPIRTKFEEGENFRALLRRVRGTVLAACDHAQLPFAKVVELALSRCESGDRSLFQAMFVLLEQGVGPVRLDRVATREITCDTGTSKLDLTLLINAEGDVWDCRLECAKDLFSAADVEQMAREMVQLFGALAEDLLRAVPWPEGT